ncbi:MAG: flagellar hook-associated protein FlgL, partial [Acidobacteriota bacterium]|nr:flagellar hook-associated protein FlgL [Acidobacteriota bacterium]
MYFRVTDSAANAALASGIDRNRQRLAEAQEQLSSGKRINRPSDDPAGAGAILRIHTSQEIGEQFRRSVASVKDRLSVADGALDSYERWLDKARSLLAQGATNTTGSTGRASIADEIDGLRAEILSAANMRSNEQYVFGGTRQTAPPFDPATYVP